MYSFLEKNWPLLTILALLIIAISFSAAIKTANLTGKSLHIKNIDKTNIAEFEEHHQPEVKLTVDGHAVENPYLITVEISNNGSIPIRRDDFDTPLKMLITNNSKIIQTRFKLSPPDMNTEITHTMHEVFITPTLMNPGNQIFLQILTMGEAPAFETVGHIEGVGKISTENNWTQKIKDETSGFDYLSFLLALFAIMMFALILKTRTDSKYTFMRRSSSIILFSCISASTLYEYLDLAQEARKGIYLSSFLLIGCSIVMMLLAWLVVRFTEKFENN